MSMYLQHSAGFSSEEFRIFSFTSAIKKVAYEGRNFALIEVSQNCLKVFSSKMLFVSTTSASFLRASLEVCLLSLDSKNLQKDVRPSLCGMLG